MHATSKQLVCNNFILPHIYIPRIYPILINIYKPIRNLTCFNLIINNLEILRLFLKVLFLYYKLHSNLTNTNILFHILLNQILNFLLKFKLHFFINWNGRHINPINIQYQFVNHKNQFLYQRIHFDFYNLKLCLDIYLIILLIDLWISCIIKNFNLHLLILI